MTQPTAPAKKKMDSFFAWPIATATVAAGVVAWPFILAPIAKAGLGYGLVALATYTGVGLGIASVITQFTADRGKGFFGSMGANAKRVGGLFKHVGEAFSVVGNDIKNIATLGNRWAAKEEAEDKAEASVSVIPAVEGASATVGKKSILGFGKGRAPAANQDAAPAAAPEQRRAP